MKPRTPKSLLVLLLLTGVCWLAAPHVAKAAGYNDFTPQLYQQELSFHQAGLRGDRSLIPAMIQSLQTEQNPDMRKSVMLALAQLGAMEALPTIDKVIQISYADSTEFPAEISRIPDVGSFARAARARLVAEAFTQDIPDGKARAQAKVEQFFQELGKSPSEVNASAAAFHKKILAGGWGGLKPVETYALQELADMIWRGPYADYAALPQVQQTDFTQDGLAKMKAQAAPLSLEAQRASLIDTISLGGGGGGAMQLLLNLGRSQAGELAAAKLWQMETDKKYQYQLTGFQNLFELLQVSGDTAHADLWAHFKADNMLGTHSSNTHEGKMKIDGVAHFVSGY